MERVFIFRPGYFGDTLVCFPLIAALRLKYPTLEVCYITNSSSVDLVAGSSVLEILRQSLTIFCYRVSDGPIRNAKLLRGQIAPSKGDALLYLPISGIKKWRVLRDLLFFKIIGFSSIKGIKGYIGTQTQDGEREDQRLFRIVNDRDLQLTPPSSVKDYIIDGSPQLPITSSLEVGELVVVVCPGSKMQSKRWPLVRFIEVIEKLSRELPVRFVLVGAENERGLGEIIKNQVSAKCELYFGRSFAELVGLFRISAAYLGNDTGPMHLAALLGVPCVSIFSSRAQKGLWHPYGNNHKIFREKIACEGCNRYTCFADPPPCLVLTESTAVLQALRLAVNPVERRE